MVGVIRTVEYNPEKNQSLLHFECTHIETSMRNEVLKFVYNMLPENEKEVLEALEQTEADESAATENTAEENKAAATTTLKEEVAADTAEDISAATGSDNTDADNGESTVPQGSEDIQKPDDEINVFSH